MIKGIQILLLLLCSFVSQAQYHGFTQYNLGGGYQALVMRPHRSDTTSKKFPVITMWCGIGEYGADPSVLFNIGVGRAFLLDSATMRNNYDSAYYVMIMASTQPTMFGLPNNVAPMLDFVKATCTRSDTTNWVWCGISQGSISGMSVATWPYPPDGSYASNGNGDDYRFKRFSKWIIVSTCNYPYDNYRRFNGKGVYVVGGDQGNYSDGLCYTGFTDSIYLAMKRAGAYGIKKVLLGSQYNHSNNVWDYVYRPTATDTVLNNFNIYRWVLKNTTTGGGSNVSPISYAGANQSITLPTNSVTLNGTGSFDPDGSISTYAWTKTSGPGTFTITSPSGSTTTVTGMSTAGTYVFQLQVTDNSGATAISTVSITVNSSGTPPVVVITASHSITLPTDSTFLSSAGSSAGSGTLVDWNYEKISGPGGQFIYASRSSTTKVYYLTAGVYIFRLTLTNSNGISASAQDTVTVNPAAAPPNCVGNITPVNLSTVSSGTGTTLTWNAAGGATGYKVYLYLNGGSVPGSPTYTTSSTTQAVTGLTLGFTYKFFVVPYNGNGDGTGCSTNLTTFKLLGVFVRPEGGIYKARIRVKY